MGMRTHGSAPKGTAALAFVTWTWLAAAPLCGAADSGLDAMRKLAEQGDVQAAVRLATSYDSGMGAPRDDAEAAKWYERAARLGDPDAQFRLGILYREGRGVMKDATRAYAWFHLAASNPTFLDNDDAATYRDEAAKGMDSAQLDKTRELARAWAPPAKGTSGLPPPR